MKIILNLVLFIYGFSLFAQQPLELQLQIRGEIVVSIDACYFNDLGDDNRIWVDKVKNGKALLYLNASQYKLLLKLGIPFVPELAPSLVHKVIMAQDIAELEIWNSYPTYATYISFMEQLATDYPEYCQLVSIGQTVEGRKILALKISDNVAIDESEPEVFYTSSMHGDELVGYVLMMRLADYLLKNRSDKQVKNLIENLEIYINPLANPDGTYAESETTVNGATRNNANGVNLNRNFPDAKDGDHPDGYSWQPENIAMMDFMMRHHFVLSMNLHGGAEVLNYPWDTFLKRHADDNWYAFICREYADTVHAIDANYLTDLNNGITNGYDWYTISGGRQDYMNYFLNGREITLELSTEKLTDGANLPGFWDKNYKSLLNYMQQALFGVTGFVTDSLGKPISAKITVLNHDKDNSWVSTDTNGFYCRFLAAGSYSLQVAANGYAPLTIDNVNVENYQQTVLNVNLTKAVGILEHKLSALKIYPNPANDYINITSVNLGNQMQLIAIYDIMGHLVLQQDASLISQLKIDVSLLKAGIYYLCVSGNFETCSSKFIINK